MDQVVTVDVLLRLFDVISPSICRKKQDADQLTDLVRKVLTHLTDLSTRGRHAHAAIQSADDAVNGHTTSVQAGRHEPQAEPAGISRAGAGMAAPAREMAGAPASFPEAVSPTNVSATVAKKAAKRKAAEDTAQPNGLQEAAIDVPMRKRSASVRTDVARPARPKGKTGSGSRDKSRSRIQRTIVGAFQTYGAHCLPQQLKSVFHARVPGKTRNTVLKQYRSTLTALQLDAFSSCYQEVVDAYNGGCTRDPQNPPTLWEMLRDCDQRRNVEMHPAFNGFEAFLFSRAENVAGQTEGAAGSGDSSNSDGSADEESPHTSRALPAHILPAGAPPPQALGRRASSGMPAQADGSRRDCTSSLDMRLGAAGSQHRNERDSASAATHSDRADRQAHRSDAHARDLHGRELFERDLRTGRPSLGSRQQAADGGAWLDPAGSLAARAAGGRVAGARQHAERGAWHSAVPPPRPPPEPCPDGESRGARLTHGAAWRGGPPHRAPLAESRERHAAALRQRGEHMADFANQFDAHAARPGWHSARDRAKGSARARLPHHD